MNRIIVFCVKKIRLQTNSAKRMFLTDFSHDLGFVSPCAIRSGLWAIICPGQLHPLKSSHISRSIRTYRKKGNQRNPCPPNQRNRNLQRPQHKPIPPPPRTNNPPQTLKNIRQPPRHNLTHPQTQPDDLDPRKEPIQRDTTDSRVAGCRCTHDDGDGD